MLTKKLHYWFYGLPALPLAALGLPLYIYLPTFYADQLGLGLTLVGSILLISRVTDVISDPLIGLLSDWLNCHQQEARNHTFQFEFFVIEL